MRNSRTTGHARVGRAAAAARRLRDRFGRCFLAEQHRRRVAGNDQQQRKRDATIPADHRDQTAGAGV